MWLSSLDREESMPGKASNGHWTEVRCLSVDLAQSNCGWREMWQLWEPVFNSLVSHHTSKRIAEKYMKRHQQKQTEEDWNTMLKLLLTRILVLSGRFLTYIDMWSFVSCSCCLVTGWMQGPNLTVLQKLSIISLAVGRSAISLKTTPAKTMRSICTWATWIMLPSCMFE